MSYRAFARGHRPRLSQSCPIDSFPWPDYFHPMCPAGIRLDVISALIILPHLCTVYWELFRYRPHESILSLRMRWNQCPLIKILWKCICRMFVNSDSWTAIVKNANWIQVNEKKVWVYLNGNYRHHKAHSHSRQLFDPGWPLFVYLVWDLTVTSRQNRPSIKRLDENNYNLALFVVTTPL